MIGNCLGSIALAVMECVNGVLTALWNCLYRFVYVPAAACYSAMEDAVLTAARDVARCILAVGRLLCDRVLRPVRDFVAALLRAVRDLVVAVIKGLRDAVMVPVGAVGGALRAVAHFISSVVHSVAATLSKAASAAARAL